MLFDTSSPGRKRVLRIVYSVLAFLFFIGFVGFGIGGEVGGGGILDGLTGGGGGGDAAELAQDDVEAAEERLAADPSNERALADLILARVQLGNARFEVDDQGAGTPTDESFEQYALAAEAWERYVELDPERPSAAAAGQLVGLYPLIFDQTYQEALSAPGSTTSAELNELLAGAQDAAEVQAEQSPGQGPYLQVALFAYARGDERAAQAARRDALGAEGDIPRKSLERTFDQYAKQGERIQKAIEALDKLGGGREAGEEALTNPFGGLGGGAGGGSLGGAQPPGAAP